MTEEYKMGLARKFVEAVESVASALGRIAAAKEAELKIKQLERMEGRQ